MSNAVDRDAGVSAERERRWGRIGALVGSAFGIGSAVVAVAVDGASPLDSGPYPEIFERRELLGLDLYLLAALAVGAGFSAAAAVHAKTSAHPRSDAFGAILMGGVLTALAGFILFLRVYAVVSAS